MSERILPKDLSKLRRLEKRLKTAQNIGCVRDAEQAMKEIQNLLASYKDHYRLLENKLWYFETLLDANDTVTAESGFNGIRSKADKTTQLYLEATFFLSVCYLRQKRVKDAKTLMREFLSELNKERVSRTRQLLQKRIIARIEEESILAELIGAGNLILRERDIQDRAIELMNKSNDEIMELPGRNIPYDAFKLLQDVREDVILQLSLPDRKLLPPPGFATNELSVGKRTFAVLKRVGWKTLCDAKSPLFKLWSKKVPEVYSGVYFSGAVVQAFNNWRIGVPLLAAGIVAITMRYGAEEFCIATKPDSIMEVRGRSS